MTIAPAFTIGLNARPLTSSRLIVLNGSPVGSAPILDSTVSAPLSASARAYTNGLETDWIVKGTRSPAV